MTGTIAMKEQLENYFATLARLPLAAEVSDRDGRAWPLDRFFSAVIAKSRSAHADGKKLMFIGNGGSATIASHMAIDFSKNGGIRALAFNDGAALTCLGNDLGYENVFAQPIEMHAQAGDLLFAISSSGNSDNILRGVAAARARGCTVVTLSGFAPDNALRALGDINLYVAAQDYGFVEIAHLSLCHALLDLAMGWGVDKKGAKSDLKEIAA